MAIKKQDDSKEINVLRITQSRLEVCILGVSPIILNRLSQKAQRELLMPKKKTAADKAANLKHNPFQEFRDSAYLSKDPKSPTVILVPATAFKSGMRNAAIDIPGSAAKAQIGRLTYVEGDYINLYGVPKLHMAITRNSDMNRTPDVRTRVIVPQWACRISVKYVTPVLKESAVANLLAAAGMIQGVGDWRTEKGKGDYGQFELCNEDDPRFVEIMKDGGRKQQQAAFDSPQCYDAETAELLAWFSEEAKNRGFKAVG